MGRMARPSAIISSPTHPTTTPPVARGVGRNLRRYAVALLYSSMAALVVFVLWFAVARPVQVLPRIRPVPPFLLQDQDERWVDALALRGQFQVISFGYTRCGAGCAAFDDRLVALRGQLATDSELRNAVVLLTISFDSDHDTPAVLRSYAAHLAPGPPAWRWLTGSSGEVKGVVGGGFGVYYGERPSSQTGAGRNQGRFIFDQRAVLVDPKGVIRAEYDTAHFDAARVLRDIALIRREAASSGLERQIYEASHLFLCYPTD